MGTYQQVKWISIWSLKWYQWCNSVVIDITLKSSCLFFQCLIVVEGKAITWQYPTVSHFSSVELSWPYLVSFSFQTKIWLFIVSLYCFYHPDGVLESKIKEIKESRKVVFSNSGTNTYSLAVEVMEFFFKFLSKQSQPLRFLFWTNQLTFCDTWCLLLSRQYLNSTYYEWQRWIGQWQTLWQSST